MLADSPTLRLFVESLDDLERTRIATENRLRALTATEPDVSGEIRSLGLPEDNKLVQTYAQIAAALAQIETDAIKVVEKQMREHPLGAFVESAPGLGKKQAARLLAVIGDPYWNLLHERPRTVSELWAYCGLHTVESPDDSSVRVSPRRRRGQKANWNDDARKRAWLIANSAIKVKPRDGSTTPYRKVYDDTRAKYEEAVHKLDCAPCKAKVGEPLKDGHKHSRALRAVAKAVLKDLWRASKAHHEALQQAA